MPRVLKDLKISEVSGVDRGAGEGVRMVFMKRHDDDATEYWKRDFTQQERDDAASSGAALPDGSFPIKNKGDLKNAIRAIGRASNPTKAKTHIKTRAQALDATDMLPDDWQKRDAQEIEMTTEAELKKMISDAIAPAVADAVKKSGDALAAANAEIAVLKMSDAEKAHCDKKEMTDAQRKTFAGMSPDDRKAEMEKSLVKVAPEVAVLNAEIAKRDVKLTDMEKRLAAHDEREAIAKFAKRATDAGLKADDGEIMRKAYGGDADAQAKLDAKFVELTKALRATQDTSGIFREIGKQGDGDTGADAYNQLVAKASELRKAEPKLTPEQAFTKVYTDPANQVLAVQHRREESIRKSAALAA